MKMIANFKKTVWKEESSQEMGHCMCCGKEACEDVVLMKCSACKAVVYCSSECQRKDWKTGHKQKCHILRKPSFCYEVGRFFSCDLKVLNI